MTEPTTHRLDDDDDDDDDCYHTVISSTADRRIGNCTVVACGYQQVHISRSDRFFPAWLIRFDDDDDVHDEGRRPYNDINNTHVFPDPVQQHEQRSSQHDRYWWRSKHDFRLLVRAMRRVRESGALTRMMSTITTMMGGDKPTTGHHGSHKRNSHQHYHQEQQQQQQRADWPKMAFERLLLAQPWLYDGTEGCNSMNKEKRSGCLVIPQTLIGCPLIENRWNPQLRKSLQRVNQFLKTVANTVQTFRRHCQLEDPEQQQQQSLLLLQDAWHTFSRAEHTRNVVFASTTTTKTSTTTDFLPGLSSPPPHAVLGKRFGQYFCNEPNARQLVDCFWEKLLPYYQDRCGGPSISRQRHPITIIEPSCGQGDILRQLHQRLQEFQQTSSSPVREEGSSAQTTTSTATTATTIVLGIDMDPLVLDRAQQAMASISHNTTSRGVDYYFQTADFLETRRDSIPPNDDQGDEVDPNETDDSICAIVGGPPYTDPKQEQDLPTAFIRHAMTEYRAVVIAFLLPERMRAATWELPPPYQMMTLELTFESTFYFQGTSPPVPQPSIIQCFWRNDGAL